MEKFVANGIMKCEANIQDLLSELSAELNYQLEEVRMRFLTLEKVIKDDPRYNTMPPKQYRISLGDGPSCRKPNLETGC